MRKAKMSDNQYVRASGQQCPFCRSTQLEGDDWNSGGGTAEQEMNCLACGARWIDQYKLIGFVVVEGPGRNHEGV